MGTGAELDTGDTFVMDFSEDLAGYADDTGVIRVTDGDGEIFEIDCAGGGNACTLMDDLDAGNTNTEDRIEVVLAADPVKVGGPAGDGIAQVPADITDLSTVFDDAAGNDVDLAGRATSRSTTSSDRLI